MNRALFRIGHRCRFTNPFASESGFDVVEQWLLPEFPRDELRLITEASVADCCGWCPRCLLAHIIVETRYPAHPPSHHFLDQRSIVEPGARQALMDFLLCVHEICHAPDELLVGRFTQGYLEHGRAYRPLMTYIATEVRQCIATHFPAVADFL